MRYLLLSLVFMLSCGDAKVRIHKPIPPPTVVQTDDGYVITYPDGTEISVEDGKDGEDGEDGVQGPQGEQGLPGEQGPAGICATCPSLLTFNIPRGNPGACVNFGNGISARMYSSHSEANYVTKLYRSATCSGTYVATLWPNDDESNNSGDEIAWIDRTQYSIESLRDTNVYTMYLVTYP